MRAGGVLQDPVPQPAHQVRQAAAEAALPEDGVCLRDRAALLREAGGQDADRDPHQGHAALGAWPELPVAREVSRATPIPRVLRQSVTSDSVHQNSALCIYITLP